MLGHCVGCAHQQFRGLSFIQILTRDSLIWDEDRKREKLPSLLILVFVDSAWRALAPYTMQYISPWDCPHPEQNETPYDFNFPAETKRIGFRTRWQISEKSNLALSKTPHGYCVSSTTEKALHYTLPVSSVLSPKTPGSPIGEQITFLAPLSNILFPVYCLGTQKWQSWEPEKEECQKIKKEKGRVRNHSRFSSLCWLQPAECWM